MDVLRQVRVAPLDRIDRIEILRGAASALYGPDAVGGVVQIFEGIGPLWWGIVDSLTGVRDLFSALVEVVGGGLSLALQGVGYILKNTLYPVAKALALLRQHGYLK